MKERRMEHSKAEELVNELTGSVLNVMKNAGVPVEVGAIGPEDKALTEEKVKEFTAGLDRIFWGTLRERYVIKETITRSEAKELFDEVKSGFFKPFEERGIYVIEGMPDGSGRPYTKEQIEKINREIDGGIWRIINDFYEMVDD